MTPLDPVAETCAAGAFNRMSRPCARTRAIPAYPPATNASPPKKSPPSESAREPRADASSPYSWTMLVSTAHEVNRLLGRPRCRIQEPTEVLAGGHDSASRSDSRSTCALARSPAGEGRAVIVSRMTSLS